MRGQTVTWLVPHSVAQVLPNDVDFRVMLTFLEFYHTLLTFAMFKLYHDLGLAYPPAVQPEMDAAAAELAAIVKELSGGQQAGAAARKSAAAALTPAQVAERMDALKGDLRAQAPLPRAAAASADKAGSTQVSSDGACTRKADSSADVELAAAGAAAEAAPQGAVGRGAKRPAAVLDQDQSDEDGSEDGSEEGSEEELEIDSGAESESDADGSEDDAGEPSDATTEEVCLRWHHERLMADCAQVYTHVRCFQDIKRRGWCCLECR